MSYDETISCNRKLYDLSEAYKYRDSLSFKLIFTDAISNQVDNQSLPTEKEESRSEGRNQLMAFVDENVIGRNMEFSGPLGKRCVVYCDYTASGKSLGFIENYIINEVLPSYANTHTTSNVTSMQTTLFRHEAR